MNFEKAVFRIRGKSNTFPDLLGKGVQIKTLQKFAAISFVLQAPTSALSTQILVWNYKTHDLHPDCASAKPHEEHEDHINWWALIVEYTHTGTVTLTGIIIRMICDFEPLCRIGRSCQELKYNWITQFNYVNPKQINL